MHRAGPSCPQLLTPYTVPVSKIHHGLMPRVCESPIGVKPPAAVGSSSSSEGSPQQVDCSTLVLSYAPTPATAAGAAATSLVQNYASSIVAWSDVFDVYAVPCDAWWLRGACAEDGSELCVGDVDQLRTMSGRLARAAQLAGSGGKWGLLQAVLLSWDSAPASAQSWVRQQIALEACCLLILPAAAGGLEGDVQAAWEALPGKEQQLWCQLQQARLLHSRHWLRPVGLNHYTMDESAIAALLQRATGVPEAGALLLAEPATIAPGDLAALNMFPNAATRRRNMDASYTALLLCCRVYGTSHPRTQEALEDTRVTDPQGWVPLLLAGLAYPSLTKPPGVMKGSKQEAEAYVYQHGVSWAYAPSTAGDVFMTSYTPDIIWLLQQRGIQLPSKQQQADLWALRRLNCGQPGLACNAGLQDTNPLGDLSHRGLEHAVRQMGLVQPLRACLVTLGSALQVTYNLPPLDVAPQLWRAVADALRMTWDGEDLFDLRENIYCHIAFDHSMALDLLAMVPRMKTLVPQAKGGFWRAAELGEMQAFLSAATSSMCRVYWQLGLVEVARSFAQTGWEEQQTLEGQEPGSGLARQTGVSQPGTAPWEAIQTFLSQQQQQTGHSPAAGMGAGFPLGSHNSRHTSSTSSSTGYTSIAPRREIPISCFPQVTYQREPLFDSFPGWVDQLVSQVVGRPVKLDIELEQLINLNPWNTSSQIAPNYHAEVYLEEADGSKVPFSWGEQPSAGSSHNTQQTSCSTPQHPAAPSSPASGAGGGVQSSAEMTGPPGGSKEPRPCAMCGQLFTKLHRCARCKQVLYCSKEHQKAHWKLVHKLECKEQPSK